MNALLIYERKKAKIRYRYNRVPHLTQGTTWECDKNTRKHHTHESQEASPFPAGDHNAAKNRQESMTDTNKNKIKKIHKRSTALERSEKSFHWGVKLVLRYQTHPYFLM